MADDFESLLKASIGLDAASIGASAIERAVRERQAACQLQGRAAYWERVRQSPAELQALIDAVVVPETWFFRDVEVFSALGRFVRDTWRAGRPNAVLRALSLPCSTGEEPYSIAMALLDAAIPPRAFRVDGIDISVRSLNEARAGAYRKGSFRGTALDFRERYFERAGDRHRIVDRVRRQVDFRHGNVLSLDTLPGAGIYDVVFCRNVLIYFDRAAQARAAGVLADLLAPEGLLFVGPAEGGVLLSLGFVPAGLVKAHAFRRPGTPAQTPRSSTRPHRAVQPVPAGQAAARRSTEPMKSVPAPLPPANAPLDPLDAAAQLANEGRFADAAKLCEEHLRSHGPSAQAFYFLGLVRDAGGDVAVADACYRKALYLDPHHHDALLHLALLMEARNNNAEASRLRSRAQRASQQERRS
jgi:chemotaxis protein methyltransferase WspC